VGSRGRLPLSKGKLLLQQQRREPLHQQQVTIMAPVGEKVAQLRQIAFKNTISSVQDATRYVF